MGTMWRSESINSEWVTPGHKHLASVYYEFNPIRAPLSSKAACTRIGGGRQATRCFSVEPDFRFAERMFSLSLSLSLSPSLSVCLYFSFSLFLSRFYELVHCHSWYTSWYRGIIIVYIGIPIYDRELVDPRVFCTVQ